MSDWTNPDVQKVHEQIWEIRSDALRAANRMTNGDYRAVKEIMESIESRTAEVKHQLNTHPALRKK